MEKREYISKTKIREAMMAKARKGNLFYENYTVYKLVFHRQHCRREKNIERCQTSRKRENIKLI